jgi:hypothetical protein
LPPCAAFIPQAEESKLEATTTFSAWVLTRALEAKKVQLAKDPSGYLNPATGIRYQQPSVFSGKEAAQAAGRRRLAASEQQLRVLTSMHAKRKANVDKF